MIRSMFKLLPLLLGLVFIAGPSYAGDRVKLPELAPAKGDKCVEPTDVMRRDHMEFILHQRDETVYGGIRTSKHSFAECINCHVTPRADGSYPRVSEKDHFCASCHSYASVKVDCFSCHADRPEKAIKRGAHGHSHASFKNFDVDTAQHRLAYKDDGSGITAQAEGSAQ